MKYRLTAALIFLTVALPSFGIDISEDTYAGAPHFIIKTKKATYYLDKEGGGLSRMIDIYGNDWINFKREPWDSSEDGGAGHPGHKKCYSFMVDESTILTISRSGKWQWRWKFYDDHATITMEKVDHEHKYWFLYEGPIAGEFNPEVQYWGTNLGGPRKEINDFNKGNKIFANWHWIYFGDERVKQVIFIAMKKPDRLIDLVGFMGDSDKGVASDDGMVVFGFGRHSDAQPQLTDPHNTFYIGFLKRRVKNVNGHESVAKDIANILK